MMSVRGMFALSNTWPVYEHFEECYNTCKVEASVFENPYVIGYKFAWPCDGMRMGKMAVL